jgi:hypothetical protein
MNAPAHAVVSTSAEVKASMMDKIVTMDSGTHSMRIIGVGNYCPAEDTIYLHLASTTKFRPAKNGKHPVQYCGWYYLPHLEFAA